MKTFIKLAAVAPILLVLFFQAGMTSCSKDPEIKHDTVTVTNCPTINVDQVLTGSVWIVDSIRFLQNNTMYYYKRGASGNTANFDTETIKFNTDKTGTYVAGGITYSVNWDWANAEKTRMQYTISYSPTLYVTWDNITITNSTIKYTEFYNRTGTYTMGYAVRKKQ